MPLPGVKTKAHADEVAGCLGWWLQKDDVDILDAAYEVRPWHPTVSSASSFVLHKIRYLRSHHVIFTLVFCMSAKLQESYSTQY